MNYANDKGYTANTGHKHNNFKKLEETSDSIYLNDSELETLYNLNLSEFPKLDRVRDLFLIGCHTGLRYSDLSQLTENSITDGGTRISITTAKTGERVVIPLHWQVKAILQKWNGIPPRSISNQKMNEYLKNLGEKAELFEPTNLTITRGGFQVSTNYKKWQLITVHTARRSFATNMFLADVPSISIMKITGHRTEKAFMKYIKITQEQNADKLATHPRFTKSPLKVVNE
jgi:integrase